MTPSGPVTSTAPVVRTTARQSRARPDSRHPEQPTLSGALAPRRLVCLRTGPDAGDFRHQPISAPRHVFHIARLGR